MSKCAFPNGTMIKPDGIHELDPCFYQTKEIYANVTIEIMRCKVCGTEKIVWHRQENTEEIGGDLL